MEKLVEVPKYEEKIITKEMMVEKIVEVMRDVPREVYIDKMIYNTVEVPKVVEIDRQVIVPV